MSETHSSPPRRAAFVFVFITVLLDMLALGIVIPVLPKLVVDFLSGDTARVVNVIGRAAVQVSARKFRPNRPPVPK